MSLSYGDLKKGVLFVLEGQPYEVLEGQFLRMQQRKAVMQTKIRNLMTGKIIDRNWQASDEFEEAEVERKTAMFIYVKPNRQAGGIDEYWFNEKGNPANRFSISAELLGEGRHFLKTNVEVAALEFRGKVIKVSLPVKMDFEVTEAPPSVKGNTAQGGNKSVTIDGGAKVNVPVFINAGDIIKINTETGEYVERVEKK